MKYFIKVLICLMAFTNLGGQTTNRSLSWELRGRYDPPTWGYAVSEGPPSRQDFLRRVKRITVDTIRLISPKEPEWGWSHIGNTHGLKLFLSDGESFMFNNYSLDFGPETEYKVAVGTSWNMREALNSAPSDIDALRFTAAELVPWTKIHGLKVTPLTKLEKGVSEAETSLYEEWKQPDHLDVEFELKALPNGRLKYEIRNASRGGNLLLSWDHGQSWKSLIPDPPNPGLIDQTIYANPTTGHRGMINLDQERLAKNPDPIFLIQGTRGLKIRLQFFSYLRGWLPEPFKGQQFPVAPSAASEQGQPPRIVEVLTVDLPEDMLPPHRYLRIRFNKPIYGLSKDYVGPIQMQQQGDKVPSDGSLLLEKLEGPIGRKVWIPYDYYYRHQWCHMVGPKEKEGVDQVFIQMSRPWEKPYLRGGHYRIGGKGTLVDEEGRRLEGGSFEFDAPKAPGEVAEKPIPDVKPWPPTEIRK